MTPATTLLRPVLEAAVQVARAGEQAQPSEPAPAALRRYLSFARLPGPALEIARKVLDDDDEFRARVAAATSEAEVGEAGWLWLKRPEGWEARLDALKKEMQHLEHAAREEKADREAHKRLAGAEAAARRGEAAAAVAGQEAERLRAELAAERAERARLHADLVAANEQMARLSDERVAAVRDLKEVEALLTGRTGELRHARHQLRMLQAELQQALDAPPPASPAAPAAGEPRIPAVAPIPAAERLDREGLSSAVGRAADAARQLSSSLEDAARLLELGGAAPTPPPPPPPPPPASAGRAPSRRPLRLPPGVFDDSGEAADHLVRAAGALLLVDGYNVAKAAWTDAPTPEMRSRLVNALSELHARAGTDVEVVFDGAEPAGAVGEGSRPGVRVRFSPLGVEADDVVLDRVAGVPAARPVIVASSDNRVREGARRLGANVIHARQLLAALRR